MRRVKKHAIVTAGFMCAPKNNRKFKLFYDAEEKIPIINSSHKQMASIVETFQDFHFFLTWDVDEAVRKDGHGESRSEGCGEEHGGDGSANASARSRPAHDEHVKKWCHALRDDGSVTFGFHYNLLELFITSTPTQTYLQNVSIRSSVCIFSLALKGVKDFCSFFNPSTIWATIW